MQTDDNLNIIGVKLGDFGLCAHIDNPFIMKLSHRCGTLGYMSPEQLRRDKYNEVVGSNQSVDIFGLAVVAYFLIHGRHPFIEPGSPTKQISRLRHISCDWDFPGNFCTE